MVSDAPVFLYQFFLMEAAANKTTRFYTFDEVVVHNKVDDLWVVVHKNILNLTPLLQDRLDSWNENLEYLLAFGGKNISNFFHKNCTPKTEISAKTGKQRVIFYPILETARSDYCKTQGFMWSQDPFYYIGRLTIQERRLRIINTLTGTVQNMLVCEEDTIYDIQRKYKQLYNNHAGSYTWRKYYKNGTISGRLHLNRTLTENGMFVEKFGIGPPPGIWLFYNDDFTVG